MHHVFSTGFKEFGISGQGFWAYRVLGLGNLGFTEPRLDEGLGSVGLLPQRLCSKITFVRSSSSTESLSNNGGPEFGTK